LTDYIDVIKHFHVQLTKRTFYLAWITLALVITPVPGAHGGETERPRASKMSQIAGPLFLISERSLSTFGDFSEPWLGINGVLPPGVNRSLDLFNSAILDYVKFRTMQNTYRQMMTIWGDEKRNRKKLGI
jgi:hypothetical protein